jgi:hypothetical protein
MTGLPISRLPDLVSVAVLTCPALRCSVPEWFPSNSQRQPTHGLARYARMAGAAVISSEWRADFGTGDFPAELIRTVTYWARAAAGPVT